MSDPPVTAGEVGLRALALQPTYDTDSNVLTSFYIPVLERASHYDRVAGYFSSAALSVAARGIAHFITAGGKMRLLVGAQLSEFDAEALEGRTEIPAEIAERWSRNLLTADEVEAERLRLLAWLVREGRLEVKVAVAIDGNGRPVPQGPTTPYFHEKIGVIRDVHGDGIAFTGSVNETARAWTRNFESLDVFSSWATPTYFEGKVVQFEKRWAGELLTFRVYPLPDAPREALITALPESWTPPRRDPELPPESAEPSLVARFLADAPRVPGAERLAEATTGIRPYPHQTKVAERLAGLYPRSWLVADEVGLGKTISAGLALRRLLLSGRVDRALILAPANVCRQWQDELFEKFGLWIPRLDGSHVELADGTRTLVEPGQNPYTLHPVLIASSHLARRRTHRPHVFAAAPFDLIVLDEAHHARRRGFVDLAHRQPNHLMRLMDELRDDGRLRALWMLTATPMQLDPIELRDLLRYVGLGGAWENWASFQRFFATLAGDSPDWQFVARMLDAQFAVGVEPDQVLAAQLGQRLTTGDVEAILRFHESVDPAALARSLTPVGRGGLARWAKHHSPVGQLVTRHTRQTLRRYRDDGILTENVAERKVIIEAIEFSDEERELYDELDALINRLMQAKGSIRGAGFVLTVYQRRLTSSWNAIRRSFLRRLQAEGVVEGDVESEDEHEDVADLEDEVIGLPLTPVEMGEMRSFLGRLEAVRDSKFSQLLTDLDAARARGDGAVVFTQYTDTLDVLKNGLATSYGPQLAVYPGEGGKRHINGDWVKVAKADLVAAFKSGACSILLATDAASEGLNLQYVSTLINYDLPWNPMRVEQRIGRIDRIGQRSDLVTVVNYVIPGTVEDVVYARNRDRIDLFGSTLGAIQPILGAAEGAFRKVYMAPRAERQAVLDAELAALDIRKDELKGSGIDIDADLEDTLVIPSRPDPPVRLADLRRFLLEDGREDLDSAGVPSTFDPSLASRDPENFAALATYGHPGVERALRRLAASALPESLVRDQSEGVVVWVRADRVPPSQIRDVADLDESFGPAVALGDARNEAERLLSLEVAQRQAGRDALQRRSRQLALQTRRAEFVDLVRQGIAAYRLVQRLDNGLSVSPETALDRLPVFDASWRSVSTVAAYLRISPSQFTRAVDDTGRQPGIEAESPMASLENATRGLRRLFDEIRG